MAAAVGFWSSRKRTLSPPLRVAVLGAGTVGNEVVRALLDRREGFEVVAEAGLAGGGVHARQDVADRTAHASRLFWIVTGDAHQAAERLHGTLAAVTLAAYNGAAIVRVHDVASVKDVLAVADATRSDGAGLE